MYPRNNATPPRLAIGQVVQISDGAVQSSGVTITVRVEGGSEATGGGTTAYGADGTVYYTPTQAETNYTAFVVIANKASCFSASITVVTTATAVSGTVDIGAVSGDATAADNLELDYDGTGYAKANSTIGTATDVTNGVTASTVTDKTGYSISGTKTTLDDLNDVSSALVADAVWDEATAGHVVGGTFGKMLVSIYDSQIAADGQINDVSATATAFITNLTEASDDHYNDAVITFVTGNLSGQSRVISDYDGATKTVTLDEALTEVPADGDEFLINTGHVHTESNIANAVLTQQMTESYATDGTAPTLAQAQFAIQQFLQETNVSGTTLTVKKLDGSTTAMTFTLDDATSPTSLTRAT